MRPPPGGMPAHTLRTSAAQVRKIGSSCRGRKRRSGNDSGSPEVAVSADGDAGAAPAPPIAASAPWHGLESSAALRSRHCSAARVPGCTPEQCEMKSDLQEARIALICFALGCRACVGCGAVAAGGGETSAGAAAAGTASDTVAAALVRSAFWQDAESCAALARKQSRSSGLLGAIHEQCDTKSSSVQA
jgi:hypothetical protein